MREPNRNYIFKLGTTKNNLNPTMRALTFTVNFAESNELQPNGVFFFSPVFSQLWQSSALSLSLSLSRS